MLTKSKPKRPGASQDAAPRVIAGTEPFVAQASWNDNRPAVLVIACSDGRMQEHTDDFLHNQLGISHYDRLFAPGGPGALAGTTDNFARSEALRRECAFLIRAHALEDIYLIFHGPSEDGPAHATCADYIRRQSFLTPNEIRAQQQKDAVELLHSDFALGVTVRMHAYRCEVRSDLRVQFVPLG